jgi:hypothetical protein
MRNACWDAKTIDHFVQEVQAVLVVRAMIRGPLVMGRVLTLVNYQPVQGNLLNVKISKPNTPLQIISMTSWLRYKHLNLSTIKQLKRFQILSRAGVFLIMAIFGGIIAYALTYFDPVGLLTSSQGQTSCEPFVHWLMLQFIPYFQFFRYLR